MIRTVICDDEKATLKIIEYLIRSKGYPVEIVGTAMDGKQAVKVIEDTKPDLVFLDIQMPFLNGFEVISEVKKIEKTKIIIITSYNRFEYAQKALRMGVSDILIKPIDIDELTDAINRSLAWKFTSSNIVNKALEYIHIHYNESFTLDDLSRVTYCTVNHLSREFKRHTNTTISQYINMVRIDNAKDLLKNEELSIAEVAEKVGYKNINNFYMNFKKFTDSTPKNFLGKQDELGNKD